MKLCKFDPPYNWEDLVLLKDKICRADSKETRLEEDLVYYHCYNEMVPKDIRINILKKMIGDNDSKILINNFPYTKLLTHLPYVKHYCLWSNVGELDKNRIDLEIKKAFPDKKTFWFENIHQIKSVPEIWHCHVIVNNS